MVKTAPIPEGHYRCNWCQQDFRIGTGAPHRTKPGVTLKSCSVACRDKLNASMKKHRGTDKRKASNAKYKASDKGKAQRKRGDDKRTERRRTCPKANLKYRLGVAAHEIWTGKQYVKTNKCALLAKHTRLKTPSALRNVLRVRAREAGIALGAGSVAHSVVPQDWYDYGSANDVRNCWDPANLGVQPLRANKGELWHLDADRLAAHPPELFPAAFPKDVMLAAARHDQGVDLHSALVLARARAEAEAVAEADSDSD